MKININTTKNTVILENPKNNMSFSIWKHILSY